LANKNKYVKNTPLCNLTILNSLLKQAYRAIAYVDGDGAHFNAIVICTAFASQSRVQKQTASSIIRSKKNY